MATSSLLILQFHCRILEKQRQAGSNYSKTQVQIPYSVHWVWCFN